MNTTKKLFIAFILIVGGVLSGIAVSPASAEVSDDGNDQARAERRIQNLERAFQNEFPWCAYSDAEKSAFNEAKGMYDKGEFGAAMQTLNTNYPAQSSNRRGLGPGRFLASQNKSRGQNGMGQGEGIRDRKRMMDGSCDNPGSGEGDRTQRRMRDGSGQGQDQGGQRGMRDGSGQGQGNGPWRNDSFQGWDRERNNQGYNCDRSGRGGGQGNGQGKGGQGSKGGGQGRKGGNGKGGGNGRGNGGCRR